MNIHTRKLIVGMFYIVFVCWSTTTNLTMQKILLWYKVTPSDIVYAALMLLMIIQGARLIQKSIQQQRISDKKLKQMLHDEVHRLIEDEKIKGHDEKEAFSLGMKFGVKITKKYHLND